MKRAELVAGVLLLVGALAALFWVVPAYTEVVEETSIQPATYPSIALWVVAILSGGLVAVSAVGLNRSGDSEAAIGLDNLRTLLLVGAIVTAAFVAMDFLGYLVGGIGLVAALMLYMGVRNPLSLALVPVGAAGVIWLFFEILLERPLP
ncbi:MAG: tripartite tricarboxylate transporter TctB family protein [Rhodospirillaceae bacterium]|nr:tripartite tricarboxylate transporter TctB family protein [Rhodospirillaceae bacterium]MXY40841.1 tripartite tricarboxylate transporter TctB family protein [Rhodospirillaceae bacterium]MYH36342.1 tripartite tricarboxylate transporter TctB family protein [Rhodospirillaceae bacterium]MYK15640.1 tripartite tricarboxylate transporter TctB family protein [Rhodospirillaceae bacterium]